MSDTTVTDKVARPVRTGAQGSVGWVLTEFIDAFFWDMNDRQYGIAVILLTVVISWIQVLVENKSGKSFLRRIPECTTPVVDNDGGLGGA